MSLGIVEGLVAQGFAEGEKLGGALLELVEGLDLGAVTGDLGGVGEAVVVFEGVEGVGPAADFGAVFENGVDELFGNGAAADLIEVFDLGEELGFGIVMAKRRKLSPWDQLCSDHQELLIRCAIAPRTF